MIGEDDPERADPGTAKVYYADGEVTELDAAFIVEGWDWVIGFDQAHTESEDYVSIPSGHVVGVRSPRYCAVRENGHGITGYGVHEDEVADYLDRLPL